MEAVGVGANAPAFVLLGLKSAQFIHGTLTSIKDGPKVVKEVAQQVSQMHRILVRIQQSQLAASDEALLSHAKTCVQDLQVLETKISRLQLNQNERRTGIYWKRLKAFVNEKDLVNIRHQIATNIGLLNTQMDLLSSDIICEIHDSSKNILKITQAIDAGFKQMQDIIPRHRTEQEYSGPRRDEPEPCERSDNDGLAKTMSIMVGKLQEIQECIVASAGFRPPNSNMQASNVSEVSENGASNSDAPTIDQQIATSLKRLFEHANERKLSIDAYSDEHDLAESIMDDLQKLLRLIEQKNELVKRLHSTAVVGRELEPWNFRSGLRRLDKWFGNEELAINEPNAKNRIMYHPGIQIQQTRTVDRVNVGVGQISLMIHKRKRSIKECTSNEGNLAKRFRTDQSISLTFLPNIVGASMLVASTTQHQRIDTSIKSFSMLVANRVLPAESRVFEIVREGNLLELRRMFQAGIASPQDHDEYGASLLHYSMENPEVCRFLIDCGLDVDHAAVAYGVDHMFGDGLRFPLQMNINDVDEPPEIMAKINKSRRSLLAAGADPTLNLLPLRESYTVLETVAKHDTPESLRLIWDPELVKYWTDINTFSKHGRTMLLMHCQNSGYGFSAASFNGLLNQGADILVRDFCGRSCLHVCFLNLRRPFGKSPLREFQALKFLLNEGADPHAINSFGESVSDIAYGHENTELGSYPGDLWDSVLQASGFDISQFRTKLYLREASYTDGYLRKAFESLWAGRETECPYWNDQPWPTLNPSEDMDYNESNHCSSTHSERSEQRYRPSRKYIEYDAQISSELVGGLPAYTGDATKPKIQGCSYLNQEFALGESQFDSLFHQDRATSHHQAYHTDEHTTSLLSPLSEMEWENPWLNQDDFIKSTHQDTYRF